jgi:propanol-preferring alcohol dehydrogenase
MKAFRFKNWQQTAVLEDVPVPEPGQGEALIRMGGAGVCHSDLHVMYHWTPETFPTVVHWSLPFTLGHENAGWLEGGDLGGLEVGAPVVIAPAWGCGRCRSCLAGAANYCDQEALRAGGLGRDGGLAEYMVVPTPCLVPLRDLEPWRAAPLTDAALTTYHAVKRCLPVLTPDVAAVVIGIGGLGHLAVEFLRELCGARIIAVDSSEQALALARELGADFCFPSDKKTAEEIRKVTGQVGAMVVLDFVGIDATLEMAVQALRRTGQIVIVGLGGGMLPFIAGLMPYGCSVTTVLGGSTRELIEVVELAEAGRIKPNIERFKLEDVEEVYRKLEANQIAGRAVITP